jgi:hypothetical protein
MMNSSAPTPRVEHPDCDNYGDDASVSPIDDGDGNTSGEHSKSFEITPLNYLPVNDINANNLFH